ncbi:MAG: PDGLE domain-containing protein [Actinobacteria bacterium]|nr:PDGLE domain-containing protein [Actinomycetota bacterium]
MNGPTPARPAGERGQPRDDRRLSLRALVLTGLAVCVLLAGVASAWASTRPDGLEFVAEKLGFAGAAGEHALDGSPLADYGVDGMAPSGLSTGLAGVVGIVVVGLVAFGLMRLLARHGTRSRDLPPSH